MRTMTAAEFSLLLPTLYKYCPIAMAIQVWANLAMLEERRKQERLWRKGV